jgi:hypothetical protein
MHYNPDELARLGITEGDIQKVRDLLLKGLTDIPSERFELLVKKIYLPYIIDMLDGNTFYCRPCDCGRHVILIVTV